MIGEEEEDYVGVEELPLALQTKLYNINYYTMQEVQKRNPEALEIVMEGNNFRVRQINPSDCIPGTYVSKKISDANTLVFCKVWPEDEEELY